MDGDCDTAIVRITIQAVNDPPVAVNDTYTVEQDGGPITLTPLALDSDPDEDPITILSINGVTLTPGTAQTIPITDGAFPNGTVTITAAGVISFTPRPGSVDPGFSGTVTFPYVISDGRGGTATANEIITVTPVPDLTPILRAIPNVTHG